MLWVAPRGVLAFSLLDGRQRQPRHHHCRRRRRCASVKRSCAAQRARVAAEPPAAAPHEVAGLGPSGAALLTLSPLRIPLRVHEELAVRVVFFHVGAEGLLACQLVPVQEEELQRP